MTPLRHDYAFYRDVIELPPKDGWRVFNHDGPIRFLVDGTKVTRDEFRRIVEADQEAPEWVRVI